MSRRSALTGRLPSRNGARRSTRWLPWFAAEASAGRVAQPADFALKVGGFAQRFGVVLDGDQARRLANHAGGHRLAEVEALGLVALAVQQEVQLARGLPALGHDFHGQTIR